MELPSRDRTICGGLFAAQRVRNSCLTSRTLLSPRLRPSLAATGGGILVEPDNDEVLLIEGNSEMATIVAQPT
jgi:hypothetical protein